MKSNLFTISVIAFLVFSCTGNAKKELTIDQKTAIKAEIESQWKTSGDGIIERDADKAFSVFSSNADARILQEGVLWESPEVARKQYAEGFKNPDPVKRKLSCDPVYYDFLDESTVIMTTIGKIEVVEDTSGQKPWVIAYTLLWRKEDTGWKIFNMHMSWK